jgi:hypothetical protein
MEPATARLQVRQRRGLPTGYLVRCIRKARGSLRRVTREQGLVLIPSSVSGSTCNADYVTKQTDAQSVMSRSPAPRDNRQHIHTLLHSDLEGLMVMQNRVPNLNFDATSPQGYIN